MSARAWARFPLLNRRCPVKHGPSKRRSVSIRGSAAALSLAGIAFCVLSAMRGLSTAHTPPAGSPPPVRSAALDDSISTAFSRFALNALLVTLLDDDEPPRWSDVALSHICGPAAHVEVNGRPLVPGSVIPAAAFTVRWSMDQCAPLEAFELSGVVELLVFHEETGLSAVVVPERMIVSSAHGTEHLNRPFAASMSLLANKERP